MGVERFELPTFALQGKRSQQLSPYIATLTAHTSEVCPTFCAPFAIFNHIYMIFNKLVKYESSIGGVSLKAIRLFNHG